MSLARAGRTLPNNYLTRCIMLSGPLIAKVHTPASGKCTKPFFPYDQNCTSMWWCSVQNENARNVATLPAKREPCNIPHADIGSRPHAPPLRYGPTAIESTIHRLCFFLSSPPPELTPAALLGHPWHSYIKIPALPFLMIFVCISGEARHLFVPPTGQSGVPSGDCE